MLSAARRNEYLRLCRWQKNNGGWWSGFAKRWTSAELFAYVKSLPPIWDEVRS
jgi:hypothetical protein